MKTSNGCPEKGLKLIYKEFQKHEIHYPQINQKISDLQRRTEAEERL